MGKETYPCFNTQFCSNGADTQDAFIIKQEHMYSLRLTEPPTKEAQRQGISTLEIPFDWFQSWNYILDLNTTEKTLNNIFVLLLLIFRSNTDKNCLAIEWVLGIKRNRPVIDFPTFRLLLVTSFVALPLWSCFSMAHFSQLHKKVSVMYVLI